MATVVWTFASHLPYTFIWHLFRELYIMRKLLLWVTLSRCFSYRDFLDSSSLQQSSGDFGDIEIDRDFRDHGDGDDDQESVRAFAWIGFTDKLQIHKKDAIENVPTPFLSIAGKTQNSPCKVVMYKSLGRFSTHGMRRVNCCISSQIPRFLQHVSNINSNQPLPVGARILPHSKSSMQTPTLATIKCFKPV